MIETLLKSDSALSILTTVSLAQFLIIVAIFIGVGVLIYKFRDRIKLLLDDYRDEENRKERYKQMLDAHDKEIQEIKKHHEEDVTHFYETQITYKQQSIDKQNAIDKRFGEVSKQINDLTVLIRNHYEETKRLKRNELREKLLNNYRHYTSLEENPQQVWNEMEADAFWHLFSDYEQLDGNGYMHTVVKPAMEALTLINFS